MTDEQPNALRLADRLEARCIENSPEMYAATEIRRLVAQRDQLLEVLKELVAKNERFTGGVWDRARAAIRSVENT